MKKLVLLFASLLSVNVALAKGAAPVTSESYSVEAPGLTVSDFKKVEKVAGGEKSKETVKLNAAQKMALKMLSKPLKKAALEENKGGVSGGMRTAIIVMLVGLILMILGLVFWLIGIVGFILFLIGLVLLLLELLG